MGSRDTRAAACRVHAGPGHAERHPARAPATQLTRHHQRPCQATWASGNWARSSLRVRAARLCLAICLEILGQDDALDCAGTKAGAPCQCSPCSLGERLCACALRPALQGAARPVMPHSLQITLSRRVCCSLDKPAEDCLAVHYIVLQPLRSLLETFGRFQATTAWFNDSGDPFGRGQSVMPWDRDAGAHVLHDPRHAGPRQLLVCP